MSHRRPADKVFVKLQEGCVWVCCWGWKPGPQYVRQALYL
jgi:hypothetical protein